MILGVVHHRLMAADDDGPVAAILAEALRGLIDFVETPAPDATEDDDARALEVPSWDLGPASPDMGGVTPEGLQLWPTGRYNGVIYALDTTTGAQVARIAVHDGPHGMAVYPQPGRYSLGHTGILR